VGADPSIGISSTSVLNRSHDLKEQLRDLGKVAQNQGISLTPKFKRFMEAWTDGDEGGMVVRYPETRKRKGKEYEYSRQFHLNKFAKAAQEALDELFGLIPDATS
jgi:hypothetical protein